MYCADVNSIKKNLINTVLTVDITIKQIGTLENKLIEIFPQKAF